MRSSTLRHRVEIQRKTESKDGLLQTRENWTTVATRWAAWTTPSAREAIVGDQLRAEAQHAFTLRRPGLTLSPRDRLKIGPRLFAITAVYDGANRGRECLVLATEAHANGVV